MDDLEQWITIQQFCERYPQFDEHQLRWALRKREENGLAACCRLFGRRLYINTKCFKEWFEKSGGDDSGS